MKLRLIGIQQLVNYVLGDLKPGNQCLRVLDIGAGSGAVGLAIATACENARITAIDILPAAVSLANENATRWAAL